MGNNDFRVRCLFFWNKGPWFWLYPKPRRWLLVGLYSKGFVWHWHCCMRDKPDESEIKDIIDLIVRNSKGIKIYNQKGH